MLPKNPYKYDHTRYCVPQLQEVLNLEDRPKEFADAKEKIGILVKKYMDPAKLCEKDKLAWMKRKLANKYPELYGGEDSERRLYFAEKVIMMFYGSIRKKFRRSQARRGLSDITTTNRHSSPTLANSSGTSTKPLALNPPGSPLSIPNATGESSSQSHLITEPATPNLTSSSQGVPASGSGSEIANNAPANTSTNSNTTLPPTPLSVVRPRPRKDQAIPFVLIPSVKSNGASKRAISYAQSSQDDGEPMIGKASADKCHVQSSFERSSISMPDPQTSLTLEPAHRPGTDHTHSESDIALVRQFLLACRPPMGHFLSRFINFGWKNNKFLYAMSTWSDVYRYQMLRRVVGTRDGQGNVGATEAEIAVLDYHLMRYGFQVEKENAIERLKVWDA